MTIGGRNDAEEAAAQAVQRVLGGTWTINDTGGDAQFDVALVSGDGRSVALEVTSFGGGLWKRTRARLTRAREREELQGASLQMQWHVFITTGGGVRELEPALEESLYELERLGEVHLAARYDGPDQRLQALATNLARLGVRHVTVFDREPPNNEPRIFVGQATGSIGGAGALPTALAQVLEKADNQAKLAKAESDERHLYVVLEDGDTAAVLEGVWPPPECPSDPAGVIDTIWVYSPSVSAYLFQVEPGTSNWSRFFMTTGCSA